ncbi:lysosome membrane protein 2-like [Stegodyphus dumicola]|uniref:lysosome membrane protein 2-like n=1 Tax=Stegodyphus dumicola TaxID=202533 RepID=UPI0015AE2593|nr:lysosome membrane protein 2-like [Stegodyphus dumicola]
MVWSKKTSYCILSFGLLLFAAFIGILAFFSIYYRKALDYETTLVNNTILYNIWKDLPLPIYEKIYFFNVTNAENFINNNEILKVQEVGPYTYKGSWVKEDISWLNGTVSYREKKTYHFDKENSVGSEDDAIYTLNGPLVIASALLKDKSFIEKQIADAFFKGNKETLIIKKSVAELAFKGYKDSIIKYGAYIKSDIPYKNGIFSWLYGKNATDEGLFTVFTGETDHKKMNFIKEWNGSEKLKFWKDDTCNMMNGTNAEVGPALMKNQKNYTFFQPLICRSLTFNYSRDLNHNNIFCRRFESSTETLASSSINSDNWCFETDLDLKSGTQDLSPCQFGAPVVLTFPHFYLSDPSYLQNVSGLNPSKNKHGSHIDIAPTIGVSVDLKLRFQMNLKIAQVRYLSEFEKINPGLYPVFWIEMSAKLTQELADTIIKDIMKPKEVIYSILGIILTIALVLITGSSLLLCFDQKELISEETKPLLDGEHQKAIYYSFSASDEDSTTSGISNETSAMKFSAEACPVLITKDNVYLAESESPENSIENHSPLSSETPPMLMAKI